MLQGDRISSSESLPQSFEVGVGDRVTFVQKVFIPVCIHMKLKRFVSVLDFNIGGVRGAYVLSDGLYNCSMHFVVEAGLAT